MDPTSARCRIAPASRPPLVPWVEPVATPSLSQPILPWTLVPQVIEPNSPVDAELRHIASALIAAVVEVLSGQRSPAQLERWLDPEVLSLVEHLRGAHRGNGLRVHSVRVHAPRPGVLEVSAHLRQGTASRAAALRIADRRGQWIGTHLAIALRPGVVNQAGFISPAAS